MDTEIANMAISHLGIGKDIGDVETENSAEARAVRRFYAGALKECQRDFPWGFTRRFVTLELVEEIPNNYWSYSYRYPSNCLLLRKIDSGIRNDSRDTRVDFVLGDDDDGTLIYTDMEDATAVITRYVDDTTKFQGDFTMSFSLLLAVYIAPRITGGDPFKLRESTYGMYAASLSKARANSANEEQFSRVPESEFIRARDGVEEEDRSWISRT